MSHTCNIISHLIVTAAVTNCNDHFVRTVLILHDSNRKLHDSSRTVHDACRHESFCKSRDPGGKIFDFSTMWRYSTKDTISSTWWNMFPREVAVFHMFSTLWKTLWKGLSTRREHKLNWVEWINLKYYLRKYHYLSAQHCSNQSRIFSSCFPLIDYTS